MDINDVTKLKVAVLGGGWSDEREISMDSARACTKALKQAGFAQVELIDVASEGFVSRLATGGRAWR